MRSPGEIISIYEERKKARSPLLNAMQEIRDIYNGDIVVPLPEMSSNEKPFVANLVAEGIDQTGMRIASVLPNLSCPPLVEGIQAEEDRAYTRRLTLQAWWELNRQQRKLRRRARYLIAYGSSPMYICPDFKRRIPMWEHFNPLSTFPAPSSDPDELTPTDVIMTFTRNYQWIALKFPEAAAKLVRDSRQDPNEVFELLMYMDQENVQLVALRRHRESHGVPDGLAGSNVSGIQLNAYPHRLGMCPAVVPGRITLDRLQGAFNQLVGMYNMQSRLMALDVLAIEKGIFPDLQLVGRPGETPRLLTGDWKDGRTGQVNVVAGGQMIPVTVQPGFQTAPTIDRLERNQMVAGGIPAQWRGETPTGIRTGRAGELTMSATVDFRIQEVQETLAMSLEEENRRAIACAKAWFGDERKSFYLARGKRSLKAAYTPNKDFTTDMNRVSYSMPGADVNSLIVGLGQRIGLGLMSKKTGRYIDPMVEDPEREDELVTFEALERAALEGVLMQAQSGELPLMDLANISRKVYVDKKPVFEAILEAQKEAQERQATPAAEPEVPGALAPETQPGLAQPGMGAEQPPAIPPPGDDMGNLTQLLAQLQIQGRSA